MDGKVPDSDMLCKLLEEEKAIDDFVKVDVYVPGCPPNADVIYYVLSELIAGRIPVLEKGKLHYD